MIHAMLHAPLLAAAPADDNLFKLGHQYGTDKVQHGFLPIYARAFGDPAKLSAFLEVGVFRGSSLRMWRDYFINAQIYGLDGFTGVMGNGQVYCQGSCVDEATGGTLGPRVRLLQANQSDELAMERVVRELKAQKLQLDVIIEDGSHLHRDQQLNLAQLFPLLRPGGMYSMEDVHTSFMQGYDERPRAWGTSYNFTLRFQTTGRIVSRHLSRAQTQYLETWVESMTPAVGEGGGRQHAERRSIASSSVVLIKKRLEPIAPKKHEHEARSSSVEG